jgi:hypothetical protein
MIASSKDAAMPAPRAQADRWFSLTILCAFTALIVVVALRHELFRDEVRAVTIAANSHSLSELLANVRNEGHPALWYLLLYGLVRLTGSLAVLKPLSAVIAVAAVWVFLRRAPLKQWQKALFAFGALPAYEYSVMCRNYGISMLILFAIAAWWRERFTRPLRLAVLMAILANTNAHCILIVGALLVALFGELLFERPPETGAFLRRWALPMLAITGGGVLASYLVIRPDATSVIIAAHHGLREILFSFGHALLAPTGCFERVVGRWTELVMRLGYFLLLLHFARKPHLALSLYLAAIGFTMFDDLIYPTYYRHNGMLYVFVLVIFWIDRRTPGGREPLRVQAFVRRYGEPCLGVLLASQILIGLPDIIGDLLGPRSMAAALGQYLQSHELANATVIGEPDPLIETLRYYAPNRIYLPRENRYLEVKVNFTSANRRVLTLDELMVAADRLPGPVVIALSHKLDANGPYTITTSYGKQFLFTRESLARLQLHPLLVRLDGSDGAENYTVYRWR